MKDKIIEIIAKQLNLNPNEIDENSSLKLDLGADSLDLVAIVSNVEELLKIEIDLTEVSKLDSIKEIEDYIEAKK